MNSKKPRRFGCVLTIVVAAAIALPDVRRQPAGEALLKQAESRLRAIYDRDEFRPQSFGADWLADSSGYTILESPPLKRPPLSRNLSP